MRKCNLLITFSCLVLLAMLFVGTAASAAKTTSGKSKGKYQYITDVQVINMREGKGTQYRIIRTLTSGDKLRILKREKKYSKVRTDKGETGWILTRFLMEEPAAKVLLPPIKVKLEKLQKEHTELSKSFKAVSKERDNLKHAAASLERLEKKHKKLLEESVRLRDAANKSNNLSVESKDLARKNATLESQVELMLRELKSLRDGNNRLWFITGAGVILIGIVIGVIIARSRKEKKSSWSDSTSNLVLR